MILQANKKFIDTSHVAHLLTAWTIVNKVDRRREKNQKRSSN